jgi:RNA polymerase sigma-70 factor, ECF subfamily
MRVLLSYPSQIPQIRAQTGNRQIFFCCKCQKCERITFWIDIRCRVEEQAVTDGNVEVGGASDQTSSTLLIRIKAKDQEAWQRLVHLYGPLVYGWCRRFGLQEADAADVGQDVFRSVAEAIGDFRHEQERDSFRGWLRTVTRTRVLDFFRRKARAAQGVGGSDAQAQWLELPDDRADPGSSADEDDKRLLIRRAVELVLDNCKEETRQSFLRVVIAGEQPADVAHDLGITVNAVYLAKSHTLRRLREEFAEIVDL